MSGIFHWNEGIIHEGGVIGNKLGNVTGTLTFRLNNLENLTDTTNDKLDSVIAGLGNLSGGNLDGASGTQTRLDQVNSNLLNNGTLISGTNFKLDAVTANQTTQITRLTEVRDYLDTVETRLAQIITDLGTYEGNRNTDQDLLNTRIGEVQASPTANTLLDRVLQVKNAVDTLNTTLGNHETNRNADADLANTRLTEVRDYLDTVETQLGTLITNLGTYEGNRNTDQDLANTRLTEVRDYLDTVETQLGTMITNLATYEGNRNTDQDLLNTKLGDTSTASTLIWTNDQMRQNQTNGTQRALVGKVVTSSPSNIADATISYPSLDAKARVRHSNTDSVDPWQTFIERYGSISTASATDVIVTNATGVASGNYPAQAIDYTVPAGRTFYLKHIDWCVDNPPTQRFHVTMAINGVKKFHWEIRNGAGVGPLMFSRDWEKGYPIAAGSSVVFYVRSGSATIFFIRFEGYEEIN